MYLTALSLEPWWNAPCVDSLCGFPVWIAVLCWGSHSSLSGCLWQWPHQSDWSHSSRSHSVGSRRWRFQGALFVLWREPVSRVASVEIHVCEQECKRTALLCLRSDSRWSIMGLRRMDRRAQPPPDCVRSGVNNALARQLNRHLRQEEHLHALNQKCILD